MRKKLDIDTLIAELRRRRTGSSEHGLLLKMVANVLEASLIEELSRDEAVWAFQQGRAVKDAEGRVYDPASDEPASGYAYLVHAPSPFTEVKP